ncbi:hypothetical protein KA529_04775 [Candidatus Saccharibacteria bacterium]|nr:hypothetical protein [Candidatus Saccharibacteria bacterium]
MNTDTLTRPAGEGYDWIVQEADRPTLAHPNSSEQDEIDFFASPPGELASVPETHRDDAIDDLTFLETEQDPER